ncbi:MAG: peptide-methionine (S)-S-oxide reductase MsrA [Proteobacteria bacterium]|nr:peptide-methionine (S)-S-oxide reductase MsrA [Pseudomonadota bacterium]
MRSLLLASISALALLACSPALADQAPRVVPAPTLDMPAPAGAGLQTAGLAGGCFWGMEGVFEHVRGVRSVVSGYSGGTMAHPTYEDVGSETTGYAESVQITYDPRVVTYGQLLRIYFSVATDPTQLNRQGPDSGTSYRGDIFAANADQARVARAYIAQLTAAHAYSAPIVTRVDMLTRFWPAEDYHQNYLSLHPDQPYIVLNDLPKQRNLQRLLPAMYTPTRAP